jgi:hypothetical protein
MLIDENKVKLKKNVNLFFIHLLVAYFRHFEQFR